MNEFKLKKYLAEGKLLKENEETTGTPKDAASYFELENPETYEAWEDVFDGVKSKDEDMWYGHTQNDIVYMMDEINASDDDIDYVMDLSSVQELERG